MPSQQEVIDFFGNRHLNRDATQMFHTFRYDPRLIIVGLVQQYKAAYPNIANRISGSMAITQGTSTPCTAEEWESIQASWASVKEVLAGDSLASAGVVPERPRGTRVRNGTRRAQAESDELVKAQTGKGCCSIQ